MSKLLIILTWLCFSDLAYSLDFGSYRMEGVLGWDGRENILGLNVDKDVSDKRHYLGLAFATGKGKHEGIEADDYRVVETQLYRLGFAYSYFPFENYNIVLRLGEHLVWTEGTLMASDDQSSPKQNVGSLYGLRTMFSIGQRVPIYDIILGLDFGVGFNHMKSDVSENEDLQNLGAVRNFKSSRDKLTMLIGFLVGWKWD